MLGSVSPGATWGSRHWKTLARREGQAWAECGSATFSALASLSRLPGPATTLEQGVCRPALVTCVSAWHSPLDTSHQDVVALALMDCIVKLQHQGSQSIRLSHEESRSGEFLLAAGTDEKHHCWRDVKNKGIQKEPRARVERVAPTLASLPSRARGGRGRGARVSPPPREVWDAHSFVNRRARAAQHAAPRRPPARRVSAARSLLPAGQEPPAVLGQTGRSREKPCKGPWHLKTCMLLTREPGLRACRGRFEGSAGMPRPGWAWGCFQLHAELRGASPISSSRVPGPFSSCPKLLLRSGSDPHRASWFCALPHVRVKVYTVICVRTAQPY